MYKKRMFSTIFKLNFIQSSVIIWLKHSSCLFNMLRSTIHPVVHFFHKLNISSIDFFASKTFLCIPERFARIRWIYFFVSLEGKINLIIIRGIMG